MTNIYQLKNKVAGYYEAPFVNHFSKEEIKESYRRLSILDGETYVKQHFHECDLYLVGTFDDKTGEISLLKDKEFVVDLRDLYTSYLEALKHERNA